MKTIFTNRRKFTLSILFAVATLSFAVLLLCQFLLQVDISPLAPTFALICMLFFGGILLQMRSGPPGKRLCVLVNMALTGLIDGLF